LVIVDSGAPPTPAAAGWDFLKKLSRRRRREKNYFSRRREKLG